MAWLWPRPIDPGTPIGSAELLFQRLRKCLRRSAVAAGEVLHLVLDPDVLLLDDPTIGVDPYTREVIFATITSLAQLGAIILIRSSEPEQLARHCTRVVVLRDGRVTGEFVGADLNTEKISLATFA